MPLLTSLIAPKFIISQTENIEKNIKSLHSDSRQVQPESLFVALSGTQVDGHDFIEKAIELGATAVICEKIPNNISKKYPKVAFVCVNDSAEVLGWVASKFYGEPSKKIKLVGVTGTNGKTTIVTLLYHLFKNLGYATGLISTVQNFINETVVSATHTTPDAIQLNALLAEMVKAGCTHCFMEVSSHAVVQRRIAGIAFAGGVFSNITHDHLDFHKTFDNYIKAKKRFFDDLPKGAFSLTNIDDKRGNVMLQNTKANRHTFALTQSASFKGKILDNTLQGLLMDIDGREVWLRLTGKFNAYNLLSIYAVGVLLGEDEEDVLQEMSQLIPAKGRFEQIFSPEGKIGIIDYAHTPDALENVLSTIQELKTDVQKVITVVGCGGNRDATKRPLMAKIACVNSNAVILTSDNPRNENPMDILTEMQAELLPTHKRKVQVIENREEAIRVACEMAQREDIILVAGKGHEDYQEIKGIKYPFDDKKMLIKYFSKP